MTGTARQPLRVRLKPCLPILIAMVAPRLSLAQEINHVPGEVIVCYRAVTTDEQIESIEARFSLTVLNDFPHLKMRHYQLPEETTVQAAIRQLAERAEVKSVDPNLIYRTQGIPSDPLFGEQWSLHNTGQTVQGVAGSSDADIDWPEAMDLFSPIQPVIVAVIDTGVAFDHPELFANIWVNPDEVENGIDDDGNGYIDDIIGWDFVEETNVPLDGNGHGTNVAFTVGGVWENNEGGSGVAPEVRIMPLRVADQVGSFGSGEVLLSRFLLATTYATVEGARIINLSVASTGTAAAAEAQMTWLDEQGVLVVAAAGNGTFTGDAAGDDNDLFPVYPASYPNPNVIAVAATDQDDQLASFSNFGLVSVDLAAPGTNIFVADVNRTFPLVEDFEGVAPGWTVSQFCPFGCPNWAFFFDALFNTWVSDGSQNAFGLPLTYLPFVDSWLTSPVVSLAFGPLLVFREWHALAAGDGLLVQITTDGVNWDTLVTYIGFSNSAAPGTSLDAGDVRLLDLSPYAGQNVLIRFRLITDGALQADGVYVDDVLITQVDIFQYDGTQYEYDAGTSFAAPLVAGTAALLMSHQPSLSHLEVRDAILDSVDQIPGLAGKLATGGRLNAHNAIQYVPEPSSLIMLAAGILGLVILRFLQDPRRRQ